jgi:hypothetical protein
MLVPSWIALLNCQTARLVCLPVDRANRYDWKRRNADKAQWRISCESRQLCADRSGHVIIVKMRSGIDRAEHIIGRNTEIAVLDIAPPLS